MVASADGRRIAKHHFHREFQAESFAHNIHMLIHAMHELGLMPVLGGGETRRDVTLQAVTTFVLTPTIAWHFSQSRPVTSFLYFSE